MSDNDWLTDDIIRASQMLLKKQFQNIAGLVDPLVIAAGQASLQGKHWIQILHISDRSHWVVASTSSDNTSIVQIYDSLMMNPSDRLIKQICEIMACNKTIQLSTMNAQRQVGPQ